MRTQTTAIMTIALGLGIAIPVAAQTPSSSPNPQPSTAPAPSAQGQTAPAPKDPVAQALNLTDDQQAKLQPIIQEEMTQINAVRDDGTMTPAQKQQKVDQIRQTEFPKIQAILTPDQRKKLAELQDQARQRAKEDNPPTTTPNNPPPQQPPQ